jgi:hypothetical protein
VTTAASLPPWFRGSRVKGHTRLALSRWQGTAEFAEAGAGFEALGARVFTRHFKTGDEDPWPEDVWQAMIDEAHAVGLRVIAYYWHQAEATLTAAEPDWICRQPDGDAIVGDRGTNLDITGPYGDVVLGRLRRLAELGVDGFMFDERHLPPRGCWRSALAAAWTAETGQPPPPVADDASAVYREFLDFKARRIEDTFARWRDAVHAHHPHVVFIVSTTTIPALTDREMTTRLARVADSAKNEYRLALNNALSKRVFLEHPELAPDDHVRQALGWTVLRDAADGRPPHIWVSGVPNTAHVCAAAGSLIAFGCIANMDVDEQSLLGNEPPAEGKTPLDALEAAFALGRRASPHLAAVVPLRWAAVHFAERARNARADDYAAAWREVLWPTVGPYQALSEDGLPVGVVNDHQLGRGDLAGYRLLVLPAPGELTAGQRKAVAAFVAGGGVVVENDPAWPWSDAARRDTAFAAFRAAIRAHLSAAPLRVALGRPGRYAVAYRGAGRLVVAVTNDFGWVQITSRNDVPPDVNEPAPPAAGVRVMWRKGHGLPETWDGLPVPRLRAIEAVSGTTLAVERARGGYRVTLPAFPFVALLVVTRARRPLAPHEQAPGRAPATRARRV